VQLVRALAMRQGKAVTAVEDWRPLLKFAGGNPLTITVVVGQALRNGLKTQEEIEDFVEKLRAGEAAFEDDVSQGRSKSLGASLSYGFENAFTEDERRQLALLHLFQRSISEDALLLMGNLRSKTEDYSLLSLRQLDQASCGILLGRASEIGLLTMQAQNRYAIHPALPAFFRTAFDYFYPPVSASNQPSSIIANPNRVAENDQLGATRAFAFAMSTLGEYYRSHYHEGDRTFIAALKAEELNLLSAWRTAQARNWWGPLTRITRALLVLYETTGRMPEWFALMSGATDACIDPADDGALPGCEEYWSDVTEFRVRAAVYEKRFNDAERLQRLNVKHARHRASNALSDPATVGTDTGRESMKALATALNMLGSVLLDRNDAGCLAVYQEDYTLCLRLNYPSWAARSAFDLGHAYQSISGIRDLAQAEWWYERSFELRERLDCIGRARCLNQIGVVSMRRFDERMEAGASSEEQEPLLKKAALLHRRALELLPGHAIPELAVAHAQLGVVCMTAGSIAEGMQHGQEAIRNFESAGDFIRAAVIRRNMAVGLANKSRFNDAFAYATAALETYKAHGDASTVGELQELVTAIRQRAEAAK
jgi:hypothetical protein